MCPQTLPYCQLSDSMETTIKCGEPKLPLLMISAILDNKMLSTTCPRPGGRAVSRTPWRLPKGSLSVPQDLGLRQVSEQRAQCTLTPAGSRRPSGRGVSVKTAERGGSLSGSSSAGAGVERAAAPHRAEGEKGRPWLVYLGREVLEPRAEESHT